MQRLQTYFTLGHKVPVTEGVKALMKHRNEYLRVFPLNRPLRISSANITRFRAVIVAGFVGNPRARVTI